jgi:hypothetical protein
VKHLLVLFGGLALALSGCEDRQQLEFAPNTSGSATATSPDRLKAGELAQGTEEAFGFYAPRKMKLDRKYPDAAHFIGPVDAASVANYVRQRVEAERVEIGAARTVFPKVRIKGGPAGHVFRIEVVSSGPTSKLLIRDVTPPPTVPGLTEEERWKRAGLKPNGQPLDPQKLE